MSSNYTFRWLKSEDENSKNIQFELKSKKNGSVWIRECVFKNISEYGIVSFDINVIKNRSEISNKGLSLVRFETKRLLVKIIEKIGNGKLKI